MWDPTVFVFLCLAYFTKHQFSHSVVSDSLWPSGLQHARLPYPSPNSWSLLKLMSIQPSHPLASPSPPALNLSQHQGLSIFASISVFFSESVLHIKWPKYWSFSFSISPSNEYSGLISFTIDWFDFAVQGTLKSLLQHHSSKASILWHSAFFMVHSHILTWLLEKQ